MFSCFVAAGCDAWRAAKLQLFLHSPPSLDRTHPFNAAQVIAEPDERYEAYCKSSDFIREHIFPGGHLPCMGVMVDSARGTGLSGVCGCAYVLPHGEPLPCLGVMGGFGRRLRPLRYACSLLLCSPKTGAA